MDYRFPYFGPLFLEMTAEDSLISRLLSAGKKNKTEDNLIRHRLAGEVDDEYSLNSLQWFKSEFENYYQTYMNVLFERMGDSAFKGRRPTGWEMEALWINYQKARDHNPLHNHSGDISFVIYLEIPDELVKEKELMDGKNTNAGPGVISFNYHNDEKFSMTVFSKLPEVGDIFMFPSWLKHSVMSFRSEVERVSVAGNITIQYE